MISKDALDWIKVCEGFRSKVYKDTKGIYTIGFGRNVQDVGISQQEAEILLLNDIQSIISQLSKYTWFTMQPVGVQEAIINMSMMGVSKVLQFKNMIACLEKKDYVGAAREVLNSKYAKDVGKRAQDIAVHMSEGR